MAHRNTDPTLLLSGKNCWRVNKADKVSFLIDADAYFHGFREAAKQARETIFICGWDIDSRLALLREDPEDDYPVHLRDFLNTLIEKNKDLQVFILIWDFAMLMGLDREWFPLYTLDWKTHANIQLVMDDLHPVGGSLHQKIIVIDDTLAFAGGLDLTKNRWDTPAHDPENDQRKNPDGKTYRPHHDVQMMVAGKTAADLGDFFRQRWEFVTGNKILSEQEDSPRAKWPTHFEPDMHDCTIGIARTIAQFNDTPEVREVEKLYLDSINLAEKYIYIENQYLTSPKISNALAESLQKGKGPEIIIVLPFTTDGWMSQHIMDQLRYRALHELRQADRFSRLGVFYAHRDGLQEENTIKIHSKLMIADDIFIRIGSANLNNRSMGLDTEYDLAIEADDSPEQHKAVADFCCKLLAEHLDVEVEEIRNKLAETGSMLKTIEQLQGNERTLKALQPQLDESVEFVAGQQYILDPEKPIDPEKFIKHWLPTEKIKDSGFNKLGFLLILITVILLALAWRFTPLNETISGKRFLAIVEALKSNDLAWLYVSGAYVFGSILIAPITILIAATVLIYGSVKGLIFSIIGASVSGAITYWIGRLMGRQAVRRLAGDKLNNLSRRLGKRGVFSTFIVRLAPIAPYSIVNIVAGATHIRFLDFMVGTILGLLPGILAVAGLVDRGKAFFTNPTPLTVLSLLVVVILIGAGAYFIRQKFGNNK